MKKKPLRFAIAGAGFWSHYQLHGWRELPGCECVAVYNRTKAKAASLAAKFGVPAVYDDYEMMLDREQLDFVDIITGVEQHSAMTRSAASRGLDIVCQKPMSHDYASAAAMVAYCRRRRVKLFINENWRWQHQIRAFAAALHSAPLGKTWRAEIHYANSFPVFENQPFLAELDQFMLTDMGTHLFDTMRFLFGEADTLYARAHSVARGIKGEDAASVLFGMKSGMTVYVNLSYASRVNGEAFPQAFITVEGEGASVSLERDFTVNVVTKNGTVTTRHPPPYYAWADSRYGVVHASIVAAQRNILAGLKGEAKGENTGEDNLKTLRLVYGCYQSINSGKVVKV